MYPVAMTHSHLRKVQYMFWTAPEGPGATRGPAEAWQWSEYDVQPLMMIDPTNSDLAK